MHCLRRMEAEMVRDSLLSVSGRLEERPFGPPDQVEVRSDGLITSIGREAGWRRSIYVLQRRKQIPTILEAFDLPQMNPNCIERLDSTVVTQSLHLLNNKVIHGLADSFAERVIAEVGNQRNEQIDRAYLIALGRLPTAQEKRLASEALSQLTNDWTEKFVGESRQSSTFAGHGNAGLGPVEAEYRALANLCHALMNSATFLYID